MSKPIRTKLRRLTVPEAHYFITAVTAGRRPIFANEAQIIRLREAMRWVKEIHSFQMHAYVFLPDHFHLLLRIGPDTTVSRIMFSIKRNFTRRFREEFPQYRTVKLWHRSFWDHVIRDRRDFVNHVNYIHNNPVKHGLVKQPEDYPHSSIHVYIRRGWRSPP